jgi:hypothetical protein
LVPFTVTWRVRTPAALGALDEGFDEEPGWEEDEAPGAVVVGAVGTPAAPPQAVRHDTRASPAAYEIGARGVRFVTNRSLGSEF